MTLHAQHPLEAESLGPGIQPNILARRMQDEMVSMVMLAAEVQIGLGPALADLPTLPPSTQRSLQAIDRLQQTLDDLQRVAGILSSHDLTTDIPIAPLKRVIKLRHLTHKLFDDVDSPFALSETDAGEIAWF